LFRSKISWVYSGISSPHHGSFKTQTLSYTGAGTVVSSNFGPQTYQLRVTTQVTGYGEIGNLGTVITTATRDSVGFDGAMKVITNAADPGRLGLRCLGRSRSRYGAARIGWASWLSWHWHYS